MELFIPLSFIGWPNVIVPLALCLFLLLIYATYDKDADE